MRHPTKFYEVAFENEPAIGLQESIALIQLRATALMTVKIIPRIFLRGQDHSTISLTIRNQLGRK